MKRYAKWRLIATPPAIARSPAVPFDCCPHRWAFTAATVAFVLPRDNAVSFVACRNLRTARRLVTLEPQVPNPLVEQLEFLDVAVAVVGGGEGVGAVAFEGEEVGGEGAERARAVFAFAEGEGAVFEGDAIGGAVGASTAGSSDSHGHEIRSIR